MAPRPPEDLNQTNFDAAEAAHYLRFRTVAAFRQAANRHGIPKSTKGVRGVLYRRIDLDKFLGRGAHDAARR
jgi:hypothetical protein